eukprot:m.79738 g.79738  ORF g.79738 m.79738 type:complete len:79 (-) comp8615_c0_seq1:111-347(-)
MEQSYVVHDAQKFENPCSNSYCAFSSPLLLNVAITKMPKSFSSEQAVDFYSCSFVCDLETEERGGGVDIVPIVDVVAN